MFRKTLTLICSHWLCLLCFAGVAIAAENYPARPITLVVPFAPGGGNDLLARMVAEKMSRSLGQPIVINNRAGAGGIVGTRSVATSPPNGYTILLGFTGTMAVNPVLYANAGYDTQKDFEPIGRIGSLPMVLVVNSASKWKSLTDMIDAAKKNPGTVTYGSGGAGTLLHIAPEMVASRAGIQLSHIPYKSTALAANDLLGGQIDMMFSSPVAVAGYVTAGRLRALAVTNASRIELFPSVPTMAEAGLPGFYAISSYGLLAPVKTPQPIVSLLNKALNEALASEDVQKRLAADATLPLPGTPQDYGRDLRTESDTWGSMVKKLGLKQN